MAARCSRCTAGAMQRSMSAGVACCGAIAPSTASRAARGWVMAGGAVRVIRSPVVSVTRRLHCAAGSPADLLVNGRLVARGEVVVVDEDFGLRVTEILDAAATA